MSDQVLSINKLFALFWFDLIAISLLVLLTLLFIDIIVLKIFNIVIVAFIIFAIFWDLRRDRVIR